VRGGAQGLFLYSETPGNGEIIPKTNHVDASYEAIMFLEYNYNKQHNYKLKKEARDKREPTKILCDIP